MTYIQLVNNVLTRLREQTISEDTAPEVGFLSDPYFLSIGGHVNDAKDRVEDAWQWGALRGTDVIECSGLSKIELTDSADNHYILKRLYSYDGTSKVMVNGSVTNVSLEEMRQVTIDRMRQNYMDTTNINEGRPYEYAFTGTNASTGNVEITVYPKPDAATDWELQSDRVKHQETLVDKSDALLIPALPVYTLAAALASRERGELSGTPTSELFALADKCLSDAIAQDSSMYGYELDWYSPSNWSQTNVGSA